MHQSHMGFIAISETTNFGLSKIIFTFTKNFLRLGIAGQKMKKLGLEPSFGPVRAQTLAKLFTK